MPQDYVNPYQGMGGQINTMQRFNKMQQQAGGVPPAMPNAPNVPATSAAPQPGYLQQVLNGLKSYFSPQHPVQPPPPNPESPDQSLRAMQELVRRSEQLNQRFQQ